MESKFNGKVGDYIENWLEQFQTWFTHRERVEGAPVDDAESLASVVKPEAENLRCFLVTST
jgi:hypothetical protein